MLRELYLLFRMEMSSGTILGYFLQALPAALLVGLVYAVLRIVYLKKKGARIFWPSEVMNWLFACYLTGLCSLVILPAGFWSRVYDGIFLGWWDQMGPIFRLGEVSLIPTLVKCLAGEYILGSWVKEMLLGNIIMLVPFGFFLPFVTKKREGKACFILAAAVPIVLETAQLVFGRSFDIDDLICNFIGIVLGLFLAWGMKRLPVFRDMAARYS